MDKSGKKEIRNIRCDAKNCVHHTNDCRCTAGNIQVGCQDACSCADTVCATFELNRDALGSSGY